jgi:hypothetical protein
MSPASGVRRFSLVAIIAIALTVDFARDLLLRTGARSRRVVNPRVTIEA